MKRGVKIFLIVGIILFIVLLILTVPAKLEESRIINIAKQTDDVKVYLESYPNAHVTVKKDTKSCMGNDISLDECYWIVVFSPETTTEYIAVSSLITSWCDKAFVRIYPNYTIKESFCGPCNEEICGSRKK